MTQVRPTSLSRSTDPAPGAHGTATADTDPVQALLEQMTLTEKLAQLVGFWDQGDGEAVAPLQGDFAGSTTLTDATEHGLGQLTRVYGTRPVDPAERQAWLWDLQRSLVRDTRLGIPALVHEECLTGLAAWKAATFPTPLAWGAAFDPELVESMAESIGRSMRALGVHQGLSPVLDVVRDPRWGRVEECMGEDPYLVGVLGTAYVRGLQRAGVHATLKHFVGYSASQAGRNFAPVHAGPRELRDVLLPPFEMAVVEGGVRSVMHSYAEIDGVPVASDEALLTDVLREEWGFDGTVVADYYGVAFLHLLHGVAGDLSEAAAQALRAGVDVELPTGDAYLGPLAQAVQDGRVEESLVDRAVQRVLRQKHDLGLLGATFEETPPPVEDLDGPEQRRLARALASRSVVLLSNDGVLPLDRPSRVALVGPNADRVEAMFGCYAFVNHVLPQHPGVVPGIDVATVRAALAAELAPGTVVHAAGCDVDSDDESGFEAAVEAARDADVAVLVMGDQSGLFGRGTSGEGCDVEDLELPGVQRGLVEQVVATGTPTVLVLLTGRPYAIGWALESCAAVVQAFFPGEEGAAAVTDVLTGRVNPSGRLPVSLPRSPGAQPYTYLHPRLGGESDVSSVGSAPALPFGHGLSYTTFTHEVISVGSDPTTGEGVRATVRVTNTGDRPGGDAVLLYAQDHVASVTRPVAQLVGFSRVELGPGSSIDLEMSVPPARLAFTGRDGRRIVEPGRLSLWAGGSCTDRDGEVVVDLAGPVHEVGLSDPRTTVCREL